MVAEPEPYYEDKSTDIQTANQDMLAQSK